jgi:UDP-N-acetylmuramoylalanine--D-glutamate ligase
MENYIKAKENIVKNQTADDVCVLNYEDKVLREFGSTLKTKVIFFSSKERVPGGIYTEDGEIISEINGDRTPIIKTAELNIVGAHNHENAMAAIACAISMNVPLECIRSALRSFKAVEHRIEFVTEKRGVRFYDDSKGTNPDAAIKAVDAMDRPTLLIGGGYDKGIPFDEWVSHFKGKVKEIELIGTTAKTIAETCDRAGFKDYHMCNSLEEAIDRAYEMADSGDAVLLSPACASWDMFKSFEERGDIFKEYVRKLNE